MDLRHLQSSPEMFREALRIDADGSVIRLADAMDPWQRADFESLDGAWKAVCGHEKAPGTRLRAYLERPRGHSKSTDISVQCLFALFASKKPLAGYACAADREQAALIRAAIQRLVSLNSWLAKIIRVDAWKVTNVHTGSTLEIISSDVGSSFGLLPDWIVCDELCHWEEGRGQDLFGSLLSSAAKKSTCLLLIISNAGHTESWQWNLREQIRSDPSWIFSRLDGPQASWITADRLAEQRRLLPAISFSRLWLNIWGSGTGTALSESDIEAALVLDGPLFEPEKGWVYVAGVDLGLSRDAAALCLVGVHCGFSESREKPRRLSRDQQIRVETGLAPAPPAEFDELIVQPTGKLKLCRLEVWKPSESAGGKVSIEDIETSLVELNRRFRLTVAIDPWQASYLVERCQKQGIAIQPVDFVPNNLKSMASATLEAFSERNLALYDDPRLLQDLRNLKVEERAYGVRLVSPRGASGHGDAACAMSIALHLAKNYSQTGLWNLQSGDKLVVY